ncbi:hypothetical protein K3553_00670 [Leisingera aquaemixtae]|uniref:hypothetical protein n=1 Tax=Leisingera aquaemixtae TaxID=1396826 RepID=UPI0021A7F99B|nr:hypothetical protein [Leisingera aquaemixtae]UWQ25003.1 hypothetical protein K3553_00670 [Leisingera aquaemixtae]
MRNFLNAIALCCGVLASPLLADEVTREDLIAQIEAGGRNETSEERREVKVEGCTLSTFRWMNVESEGWVLWTSFTVPMATVGLEENSLTPEIDHYYILEVEPPASIVVLKAKEGTSFPHEKPFHRTPEGISSLLPEGTAPRIISRAGRQE